ncbi:hypothetical protein L1D61_27150 [Vibrio mediterranei]|uniref:Uncharacterized protein n=1 Tax=Vibrio mediterranei TaxID=689 RepID=A0A3G4VN05_9VIBR|nr:hypothetical protein [Vibrio mediterranei]AYV25012.1 hypothetical protein ECB94_27225 [Vibrio mediterranei]MCG9790795.1 hypothetical protein [Vibrio mediterranei]
MEFKIEKYLSSVGMFLAYSESKKCATIGVSKDPRVHIKWLNIVLCPVEQDFSVVYKVRIHKKLVTSIVRETQAMFFSLPTENIVRTPWDKYTCFHIFGVTLEEEVNNLVKVLAKHNINSA